MSDEAPRSAAPKLVRGEPVVTRVLDATLDELGRTGYEALTLERVATRAGVNRTTIFRRWPNKAELVRAAMERSTRAIDFDWDTGSLRGDLKVLIERAHETLFAPGMVGFLRILLGAGSDPALLELVESAEESKLGAVMAFFVRAEQRGEVRQDVDKQLFLDGLMGLLIVKLVFQGEKVTPEFVTRLLDHLLAMVAVPGTTASG